MANSKFNEHSINLYNNVFNISIWHLDKFKSNPMCTKYPKLVFKQCNLCFTMLKNCSNINFGKPTTCKITFNEMGDRCRIQHYDINKIYEINFIIVNV